MTEVVLSNALADLAERVKKSVAAHERAETTAIEEALAAGRMLLEAKEQSTHGSWLVFLKRAEVQLRQAQRLMQLARSGLKCDTVSDLGGVKATLRWLSGMALPKRGKALLAKVSGNPATFGLVVPALDGAGFNFGFVRANGAVDYFKRSFVGPEPMLWAMFLSLAEYDLEDLRFQIVDDADRSWADIVRGAGEYAEAA